MIPRELNIWSTIYTIELKDKMIAVDFDNKENCLGMTNFEQKEIRLFSKQINSEMLKTLMHEILEAVNSEYRVGLRHIQIELLADSLNDTFLRNRLDKVFKF